jgi:hypothetical protein
MKTGFLKWCPDQELNLDQRFRNPQQHSCQSGFRFKFTPSKVVFFIGRGRGTIGSSSY